MFKLIPRLKPNYTFSDWLAVFNIFQKKSIECYEKEFSEKFENEYGVMFQHGRTGLYALLKVWGLDKDEVICPAYTCVVVPNAIVLSGNVPVFVDCAKDSFNMDIDLLEKAITEKTRAVIVTHIFGYPMDVIQVQDIIKSVEKKHGHKIYVIQDAAHSYGAKWNGELVSKFGDASIFGSNISKVINSIFGGMVITNSKETFEALISWRDKNTIKVGMIKSLKRFVYFIAVNIAFNSFVYGFVNWLERLGALDQFVKYFEEDKIYFPNDWDSFPSKIEARVGRNQLKKYDYLITQRVNSAKKWIQELQDKDVIFKDDIDGSTYSHCVALVEDRDKWLEAYRIKGIQLGIIIEYAIPYMKAYEKYRTKDFSISLEYSKKTINFPNWPR